MDLDLKDKVVVVTGGRGAIGSATANCFAAEGALVIVADKLRNASDDERKPHVVSGGAQYFRYLDLADELSIESFVDGVLKDFKIIDVIVNNAATFHFEPIEEWNGVRPLENHFRVGLLGPVRLIQEVWRRSPRSKSGCVINVSSVAGHKVGPGFAVYAATKFAVRALSEGVRQEVKPPSESPLAD